MRGKDPPQAFTVDVEEYFQVNAFADEVSRDQWTSLPSRVAGSVDSLLDMLGRHHATGTFFVLGWVAERLPDLPRRISDAGHEVASHGWWHRRIPTLTRDEFRTEIRDSKARLEDLTGRPVTGFRAPSFSLLPSVEWAYDILIEEGYAYDSSVFPIRRRNYGNPRANPRAHRVVRDAGTILELPMATTSFAGIRFPAAGGAYLRLLPFGITRRAVREHTTRGDSGVFYTHPWEVDPDQPRLAVPLLPRLRHYGGLSRTGPRLERLLSNFRFASIMECFREELSSGDEPAGLPAASAGPGTPIAR